MERIRKGNTSQEEEIFQFLDDCRRRKMDPGQALKAMEIEMHIEPRIGMIYLRRHTQCFPDCQ